ncbi:MAG: SMC domain protein [Anaerolineales bacterium]|nr:SMC domain protein [Anaerolineales bacterium]
MIPIRLELTNFLAYRNPAPLDFTGIHVAVLTGENGAGKSSLLDAMTWALWSRARAKTDNELVHQGQTEMRVEFTFALGDQIYRVIRARRVGRGAGSVLDFQIQNDAGKWASIAEATIPKTQEKIIRTLRLEYDTFVNSAYIMQGKADEFTGKRPTERKQVLADILGLQEWERYEERAKEKIKSVEKDIAGLEALLNEIEGELARRDEYERELAEAKDKVIEVGVRLREAEAGWAQIDAARQAMIALERQLDALTKRIRDAEQELAALDTDLREAQSRADAVSISHQREAVQQRLAKLEELESERERVTETRRASGELAAQLRGQNEAARAEADGLKKRVETLQAATEPRCPTCGQPLSEAERAKLVAELNAEVEARREAYRQNQAQLKTLTDEQAALDKSLKQIGDDLREKPVLIKQLAELQTALVQAGEAKERIAGLGERRTRWQQAIEKDRAERAQLDVQAEQYNAILRDSAAKQAALDRLRQEDTLTKAHMGAAQQKLAALDDLAKQRETKRAERNRLADDQGIYEELREAFGKRGVPAMMIEAAVPEIEAAANALLTRMTGGRMHVRFMTQRETQAGETRETLDIQISDELGTRAYEMYSGGEAFRVNFAIRIALSQLLARRAGTQVQTLIVDEGFGVLDAAGRERLVEAINAAQSDFQRILVVTHIDELKDAFPARIEITKGPDGSEITVI